MSGGNSRMRMELLPSFISGAEPAMIHGPVPSKKAIQPVNLQTDRSRQLLFWLVIIGFRLWDCHCPIRQPPAPPGAGFAKVMIGRDGYFCNPSTAACERRGALHLHRCWGS